jgi:hypothetical protein
LRIAFRCLLTPILFILVVRIYCTSLLLLRVTCTLLYLVDSHPSSIVFFVVQASETRLHPFWFHTRFSALFVQLPLTALLPRSPGVSVSFAPAWACSKEPPSPGVNHTGHSGSAAINKVVLRVPKACCAIVAFSGCIRVVRSGLGLLERAPISGR